MPRKQHPNPPHPDLAASWWAWVESKRGGMASTVLCRAIGKQHRSDGSNYISSMKCTGLLPKREGIIKIARALGVSEAEALLQAGMVPFRSAQFYRQVLAKLDQAPQLEPELRDALHDLQELTPAEQRQVGGWLQGLLDARQLAEVA